jgi:hypothetical protein
MHNYKVNDILYAEPTQTGQNNGFSGIKECNVVKTGRKYIYVNIDEKSYRVNVETLVEDFVDSPCFKFYQTEQEILDKQEYAKKFNTIKNIFNNGGFEDLKSYGISLEDLSLIYDILTKR